MRRLIAVALMLAACSSVTFAADLYTRQRNGYAPPLDDIRTVQSWSGFYLGINGGGAWAQTQSDFSAGGGPVFASARNPMTGGFGGAQIGGNWQRGPMVLGAEADFQFESLKGSLDAPPCPAPACGVALSASYSQKVPWFGTVRGRVGFASDGWLAYVTGGYAYARLQTTATATAGAITDTVTRTDMRSGWAAGAGIEVSLDRQWSAKLEYLYLGLGTKDGTFAITGVPVINDAIRLNQNLVRLGVNYRF